MDIEHTICLNHTWDKYLHFYWSYFQLWIPFISSLTVHPLSLFILGQRSIWWCSTSNFGYLHWDWNLWRIMDTNQVKGIGLSLLYSLFRSVNCANFCTQRNLLRNWILFLQCLILNFLIVLSTGLLLKQNTTNQSLLDVPCIYVCCPNGNAIITRDIYSY